MFRWSILKFKRAHNKTMTTTYVSVACNTSEREIDEASRITFGTVTGINLGSFHMFLARFEKTFEEKKMTDLRRA